MISISSGLSPLYQKQLSMDGVRAKQVIDKRIQLSPTELCKSLFFFLKKNSKKCKHSDKSSRSSESSTYLKIGEMGGQEQHTTWILRSWPWHPRLIHTNRTVTWANTKVMPTCDRESHDCGDVELQWLATSECLPKSFAGVSTCLPCLLFHSNQAS